LRTTHISGGVTDVGLFAGRYFHGQKQNIWKLKINVYLVSSFICGTLLTAFVVKTLKSSMLFVNVGLFLCVGVLYSVFFRPEREYRACLSLLQWAAIPKHEEAISKQGQEKEQSAEDERRLGAVQLETHGGGCIGGGGGDLGEEEDGSPPGDEEGLADPPCDDTSNTPQASAGADPRTDAELGGGGLQLVPIGEEEVAALGVGEKDATPAAQPTEPNATAPKAKTNPWSYRVMQVGIFLLSMNGGFVNATSALSSRGLYTSHITGNTTSLSVYIAAGDYNGAVVRAIFFFLYLFGAFVCGTIVLSDFYSLNAPYGRVFLLGTAALLAAFFVHVYNPESLAFYYILVAFCGMQSALGCKIKETAVRTTYMSGCAADIGAGLGKILRSGVTDENLRPLKVLVPSLAAYAFGSFIAALLHPVIGKYQIIISAILFAGLGVAYRYLQWRYSVKERTL
jgi:uncharacterized membrane protein YoaK (UPF0700 family)